MPRCRPLTISIEPGAVLRRWPASLPLAGVWADAAATSSWIILASPRRILSEPQAQALLRRPLPATPDASAALPPFRGGLIGWISYDIGARLEPRAAQHPTARRAPESPTPLMLWADCPNALAHNAATGEWWEIGDASELISIAQAPGPAHHVLHTEFHVGPLRSETGRDAYITACRRVIEYIRAGDVYQVNLAHRLTAEFQGSARAFWQSLVHHARPHHATYLESSDARLVLAGASPELFLAYDPAARRLTARPMKGTRPLHDLATHDLEHSPKDRAELAMIVDLMRNDLGRVCTLGSVRVDRPRDLERHASLVQATATISGELSEGRSAMDILRAAFPCGSVTGAPKIRAMQIIDELEPTLRGLYCGAAGYISDHGALSLGVTIRSAILHFPESPTSPGHLHYSVGAGIVADSDPQAEWQETLDKAGVLRSVLHEHEDFRTSPRR